MAEFRTFHPKTFGSLYNIVCEDGHRWYVPHEEWISRRIGGSCDKVLETGSGRSVKAQRCGKKLKRLAGSPGR